MAIGDISVEDGIGTTNHVMEYNCLGTMIRNDENHEREIDNRINIGRSIILKLNSVLWDRKVTPIILTQIYHVLVKIIITYTADT